MLKSLLRLSFLMFLVFLTNLIGNLSVRAMLGDDHEIVTVTYTRAVPRDESRAMNQLQNDLNNNNIDWNQIIANAKADPNYVERGYGKRTRHAPPPPKAPPPKCGHCGGPHKTRAPWCVHCKVHTHASDPWCSPHKQHHNPNPYCSHHQEHHNANPWCTHCKVHTHASDPWCMTCNIHHTATEHATIVETDRQAKISKAKNIIVSGMPLLNTRDTDTIKTELEGKKTGSEVLSSNSFVPNTGGLMFDDDF